MPTLKQIEKSYEKKRRVQKINEDQYEQAQYLETKYGPGPDPSDYTDYDDFE